ncbi:glycosyltransferase family 39 protein [Candidatus Woesebacteria bacterium]|nr:glycosyltransferase family 39 protein [Candidatus Woesebacteria bacterium]
MTNIDLKNLQKNSLKILALIVILQTFYLRFLILKVPLSVDEGLWAYIGWLLIQGKQLYSDLYSISPPLLYIPFSLSELLLGHGLTNLRIFGLSWNLLTIGSIYLVVKETFNKKIALIAAIIAFFYSIAYQQEGHFLLLSEHLSQLPLFLSIYFLLKKRFFIAGLLISITWNMREHYLILQVLLISYLAINAWLRKLSWKQVAIYSAGSAIPALLILGYFYRINHLTDYINAVFIYRYGYLSSGWESSVSLGRLFEVFLNDEQSSPSLSAAKGRG